VSTLTSWPYKPIQHLKTTKPKKHTQNHTKQKKKGKNKTKTHFSFNDAHSGLLQLY